jgi:ribonuclease PH
MQQQNIIKEDPLSHLVAAVSVGIYKGVPILDLDYDEDSNAEVDMNVVLMEDGNFIELQGTAEGDTFNRQELDILLDLAKSGSQQLFRQQKMALT